MSRLVIKKSQQFYIGQRNLTGNVKSLALKHNFLNFYVFNMQKHGGY